jgi:hypothetical protein
MNQTLSVIHSEIAKLGAQFNPDILARTRALYSGLVSVSPSGIKTEFDIAYGPNPRQMLDLYGAEGNDIRPVMLFGEACSFRLPSNAKRHEYRDAAFSRPRISHPA